MFITDNWTFILLNHVKVIHIWQFYLDLHCKPIFFVCHIVFFLINKILIGKNIRTFLWSINTKNHLTQFFFLNQLFSSQCFFKNVLWKNNIQKKLRDFTTFFVVNNSIFPDIKYYFFFVCQYFLECEKNIKWNVNKKKSILSYILTFVMWTTKKIKIYFFCL